MNAFLIQLQQRIPIKEGPEGHRAILREIYRAGHISLKDLARITLIPVPIVAKIINFLVEKEILDRIPDGILYTEKGMQFVEHELGFYGFGIAICETCKGRPSYISPRWDELLEFLTNNFGDRPQVDTQLDQSLNTPETAVQRALYLYSKGALEGKNILFLGDDDFTSVAVAHLYLGVFPSEPHLIPQTLTVVDIDDRILGKIREMFTKKGLPIKTAHWDYRKAIPQELLHQYDTIVVDPPYSIQGVLLTISRSIDLLSEGTGEIYLSFAHRAAPDLVELQQIIVNMGVAIQEIIPRFNYYEGSEILGNTTQMIRLIKTAKSVAKISAQTEFTDLMYTGEINPTVRYYYCVSCRHIVEVSYQVSIQSIEQLKNQGCPFCKSQGPFELDEKHEMYQD